MYFWADAVCFTDELNTEAPVTESSSMIEELLAAVRLVMSESLVRQVGACFQFHISTSTGQIRSYYVDLTQSKYSSNAFVQPKRHFRFWIYIYDLIHFSVIT